jgi:hypothetical protein
MMTNLKAIASGLVLGAALLISPAASAQDWRNYGGGYSPHGNYQNGGQRFQRNAFLVQTTCSGERGFRTQNRLSREFRNGNLDRWTARRIQRDIDRLRYREDRECRQGDFRSARNIGQEYGRINAWIDSASGRLNRGLYRR